MIILYNVHKHNNNNYNLPPQASLPMGNFYTKCSCIFIVVDGICAIYYTGMSNNSVLIGLPEVFPCFRMTLFLLVLKHCVCNFSRFCCNFFLCILYGVCIVAMHN